jgi:6-pyruvoyl-tetrahydropterin synthase
MWRVEVAVRVDKLDSLGMGVDFRLLKGALNRILGEFEHAILVREGDIAFRGVECVRVVELPCNPTAEVIAAVVYSRMKGEGWNVEWVRVWEGENAYVEFREG